MANSSKAPLQSKDMKPLAWRIYLLLVTVEGIVAFILMHKVRSMERSAVLWGYSLPRVVLGLTMALVLIALFAITIKSILDSSWLSKLIAWVDHKVSNPKNLIFLSLALLDPLLLGVVTFLTTSNPALFPPYGVSVAIERVYPGLIWAIGSVAQSLALMVVLYFDAYRQIRLKDIDFNRTLFFFLMFTFTAFHWIILLLRIPIFEQISNWFWPFWEKNIGFSHLYLLPILLLTLIIGHQILRNPLLHTRNLLASIILFYGIQIGFGFIEGQGVESVRLKYASTPLSEETLSACKSRGATYEIVNYEELHGDSEWLGTKPPGFIALYIIIRDIVAPIQSSSSIWDCFETLTSFYAYAFPLLAAMALVPLFYLSMRFLPEEEAIIPGMLYMLIPNVILMPLMPDQVLFPLLFTLSVFLIATMVIKRSMIYALMSGSMIFISIFISFSLLPLIGLPFIWIGIDYLFNRQGRDLRRIFILVLGICIGFGVLWLGFHLSFGYDPIERYTSAFFVHREIKEYQINLRNLLSYFILNNTELAVWMGLPIVALCIKRVIRSLISAYHRTTTNQDILVYTFGTTYLALNLLGQTKGEVGRIWMFTVPLFAFLAATEIRTIAKNKIKAFSIVVVLQMITTYLIFLFKDFR